MTTSPTAFVDAIGDTPLVRLRRLPARTDVEVWAKLEGCNPGGSAKDRSAWALLEDALRNGTIARGTMQEITAQLGRVDEVLVATSTTGTLGGCKRWVEEQGSPTRVVAVDPVGSILFGGTRATRVLNGYGAGSPPAIAPLTEPDEVARVAEVDAVVGARHLARREGILTGASGGAVISACLDRLDGLTPGSVVALVLHDFGWAYLGTVYDDAWVEQKVGVTPQDLAAALDASLARAVGER